MTDATNTDPRALPLGEWSTLPLPEGREGEEIECEWSPGPWSQGDVRRYAWGHRASYGVGWFRGESYLWPDAMRQEVGVVRWRWVSRVGDEAPEPGLRECGCSQYSLCGCGYSPDHPAMRAPISATTVTVDGRCKAICPDNLHHAGARCDLPVDHAPPHDVNVGLDGAGVGSSWLDDATPATLDNRLGDDWQSGPGSSAAALLRVLCELDEDDGLSAVYGLDTEDDADLPLESAIIAWREEGRPLSSPSDHLERIVGEVQQALAGKPAEQCVTTEGKAVAAAMKSVCITAGAESGEPGGDDIIGAIDEAESALHAVRSVCDLRGWKP